MTLVKDGPYEKEPEEIERVGIDFTDRLAVGESLSSTFTVTIYNSELQNVTSDLSQNPTRDENIITAQIKGGVDEQDYLMVALVTTTNADVKVGILPIRIRSNKEI